MFKAKKILTSFLLMLLIIMTAFVSSASSQKFKDIPSNHWANDAIKLMTDNKIISGYPDSTFKPENQINRSEFAKMMVLALNIPIKNNPAQSFKDVSSDSWFFNYVESAKYYLTGFRTPEGDYFRPNRPAEREDMAVAIVKALGFDNTTVDESILDKFSDASSISSNLKKYVAIAVQKEIMKGSKEGETLLFQPNKPITRAEAAVLLSNVLDEEKVTYDNDSSSGTNQSEYTQEDRANDTEDEDYIAPKVNGTIGENKIVLRWNQIDDERLQGYKVVISKYNSAPKYPDDGYLYWITDKTKTYAVIDNKTAYNGGDFGKYLTPGSNYYFSVTAYYSDKKVPGNALYLKFPNMSSDEEDKPEYIKPKVTGTIDDGKIVLRWNQINDERLQGYKVVISKYNSAPKYPDDGYLYWITDRTKIYAVVDNSSGYNGGDFGGYLKSGEKYYFSITAVYNDCKIPGNVITITYP
ncbi:MAG: S-layer homology domain-containing protein [Ignavibacteriales bacterium]